MLHEVVENSGVRMSDPDRMLIQACLRRDESAWEAVVQSQGRRIFNLCLRFTACREEAEDLTQEIFVRIYRSLKVFL
jgi:RNA polymerase sigma-70 factor (ECF subfamily)